MALTDAQQELLHAFVDGETTPAETVIARELLQRDPHAATYCEELRRLRHLLATHGCVKAPDGLHLRVCQSLRREFAAAPVIPLPRVFWRTALYAAAAAVVLGVGLMFGPHWHNQETHSPDEVARRTGQPVFANPDACAAEVWRAGPTEDVQPDKDAKREASPQPPAARDLADAANLITAESLAAVLRLDRGVDQPFELSVDMDRGREISMLQVYNDILVVSSMYGEACLLDSSSHEAEEPAAFAGRDFSAYEGVEIQLENSQVPELLAAIDRMNVDQGYGKMIVPADLRRSIGDTNRAVDELQELSRGAENRSKEPRTKTDSGAGAYLPPDVQREMLRRKLEELPEGPRVLGKAKGAPVSGGGMEPDAAQAESRKIKLLIRLR